jgi:hypothetical protein
MHPAAVLAVALTLLVSTPGFAQHHAGHGSATRGPIPHARDASGTAWQPDSSVFGRIEHVQKSGEELDLEPEHHKFDLTQVTLGATRELMRGRPYQIALGASVTYNFKSSRLEEIYGAHPVGFWVFLRIRPAQMAHGIAASRDAK